MIFKIAIFLLEKKVKAETNNQKKSNFLSVKGIFVKVKTELQIITQLYFILFFI